MYVLKCYDEISKGRFGKSVECCGGRVAEGLLNALLLFNHAGQFYGRPPCVARA